jgi:SAM-dependent methyltransferase
MFEKLLQVLLTLLQSLLRKISPVNPARPWETSPLSTQFGWDRGTPVDRYYLEKFFRAQGALIRGRVLEVGDSRYSRQFSAGEVSSFQVLSHAAQGDPGATIVGDLTDAATLPENAFDCFICAQTFQYTFEIQKAVQGAYRLLKPGGVLLATVPGISQICRHDAQRYGEFWRFTTESMTRLFGQVFDGGVAVESFGNVLAATAFLQGYAQEDLAQLSLLDHNDSDYQLIVTVVARKK